MNVNPEILQHEKKTGMLVTVKEASKVLKVSRNRFKEYFVETKIIEPIYLPGQKNPRFSLTDVLQLPERLKARQNSPKNFNNNKSITELAFETALREII